MADFAQVVDEPSAKVNVTVPCAGREYLLDHEVETLIEAAKGNRQGHRDATAILLAYRHGLRASEVVDLMWSDIDFTTSRIHIRRAKGSDDGVHQLGGRELRALRRLQRESDQSDHVFVSELKAPLSIAGYERMVARAGRKAKFTFRVHSHMLRHGCGYALINAGENLRAIQQHLGHKSINSTVRYTRLAPAAFKRRIWRD
jgi:integrase